jgi:hypothetical protein
MNGGSLAPVISPANPNLNPNLNPNPNPNPNRHRYRFRCHDRSGDRQAQPVTYPFVILSVAQTHSLESLRVFLTGQSRLTAKIHSVKSINQQSMPQQRRFILFFLIEKEAWNIF